MKYSINSSGYIVAERDIYSLGGFIPKGSVGAKVANGDQISQDGECWVASGDMSNRPDIRVKDNAYIGNHFTNVSAVHTDVITEFSGNTLIPGHIVVRCPSADPKNNCFIKDSFIGVTMDVLCGPDSTTTAFPFVQGAYNADAPAGTVFSEMTTAGVHLCRIKTAGGPSPIRCGKDTYVYVPTGYNCRVLWGYWNAAGQLAYSGESFSVSQALTKLEHPKYNLAMLHIAKADSTAMTPSDLLATGAKILGHVSGSLLMDLRPESVSGSYVMDNSSFIMNTGNFGLATTQLRFLAGSLFDSTMYTPTDRGDYKPYGTFHNVQRLEYSKYLGDSHRANVNRDRYVSAYDCPLLRVDDNTFDTSLTEAGNLIIRNCIVPKGQFRTDVIEGNTYEGIDFSYANADLGFTMAGYTVFLSSHKEGIYRLAGGLSSTGFVSNRSNLADSARLYQDSVSFPLDGNIVEQGAYLLALDAYYETQKTLVAYRVRTGRPIATYGANLPTLPAAFKVTSIAYLRSDFRIQTSQNDPTTIDTVNPYFVLNIGKTDNSNITVAEFVALNTHLRIIDHTKAPEITGSSYVGAGAIVRGDVKLIGDPYVNRVFDVNTWERGELLLTPGVNYYELRSPIREDIRMRLKDPTLCSPGDTLSAGTGYFLWCVWLDENKNLISHTGSWAQSVIAPSGNVKYVGIVVKKARSTADPGALIKESDIPLANVKYLRAFKKRRYITNESDRTSPEDVFLSQDAWRVSAISTGDSYIGRLYDSLIQGSSNKWCILKRPLNAGASWTVTQGGGAQTVYSTADSSWDALTKLLGTGVRDNAALAGVEVRKGDGNIVTLLDVSVARIIVDFVPTPRIVVPYGVSNIWVEGTKVRMYDNSVISRKITAAGGGMTLKGDAVVGDVFGADVCMCSNGHSDAIIKLP